MFESIERFGSATAVVLDSGERISFLDLARRADALLAGIGPQRQLVAIECSNTLATIEAYIGSIRAGHATILTGPGGAAADSDLVRRYRPNAVFAAREGEAPRFHVVSDEPADLHPDLTILLSTSGTTGSAKLVRLSRDNVASNAASIAEYLGLTPADRAITSLPMHYSYGMSVINSHLTTGASVVLTERSVIDEDFFALFESAGATNFQGVPHSFQILAHSGFLDRKLAGLRFFTQAGGKLDPGLVAQFGAYAQKNQAQFFVMYGQTEASPRIAYVPPDHILDHPDVIGRAVPGGTLSVELDGAEIADGDEGELVYRGPNVMMGYATTREELALGKVTTELRTGDLARRLPSGYFQITGRASRFIKPFGLRIGLDDVEDRIGQLGLVAAATGGDDRLVVAVEGNGVGGRVDQLIRERFGLPPSAYAVIEVDALPRMYNGKVDFVAIRALAQTAQSDADALLDQVGAILGLKSFDPSKSFVELGGDSLSYVQFAMLLEEKFGSLPENWERRPVGELVDAAPTKLVEKRRRADVVTSTDMILRAAAIVMICTNHIFFLKIDGSAYFLLILAGFSFCRFQLPRMLLEQSVNSFKPLLLNVILPYYVTLFLYCIVTGTVYTPNMFLYYSFISNEDRSLYPLLFIYFWFIESYILLNVLCMALLFVPRIREWVQRMPLVLPAILFALTEAIRIVGVFYGYDGAFNSISPIMVASFFMLGWLVHAAESRRRRLLVIAITLPTLVLFPNPELAGAPLIFVPGLLLLILLPAVGMKKWMAWIVTLVASSSFYIYLEHIFVVTAFTSVYGEDLSRPVGFIAIAIAVLLGIAVNAAVVALVSRFRGPRRSLTGQGGSQRDPMEAA